MTPEFAVVCARVLRPGGQLFFASDVAEYFAQTQAMLEQVELLQAMPWPVCDEVEYRTGFERKYRAAGRAIYRGCYQRL